MADFPINVGLVKGSSKGSIAAALVKGSHLRTVEYTASTKVLVFAYNDADDNPQTLTITLPTSGSTMPGSTFRFGNGAPAAALGSNDDPYLDTASGKIYLKATGSWSLQWTPIVYADTALSNLSSTIEASAKGVILGRIGAQAKLEEVTEAEAKAGTSGTVGLWSPSTIKVAIQEHEKQTVTVRAWGRFSTEPSDGPSNVNWTDSGWGTQSLGSWYAEQDSVPSGSNPLFLAVANAVKASGAWTLGTWSVLPVDFPVQYSASITATSGATTQTSSHRYWRYRLRNGTWSDWLFIVGDRSDFLGWTRIVQFNLNTRSNPLRSVSPVVSTSSYTDLRVVGREFRNWPDYSLGRFRRAHEGVVAIEDIALASSSTVNLSYSHAVSCRFDQDSNTVFISDNDNALFESGNGGTRKNFKFVFGLIGALGNITGVRVLKRGRNWMWCDVALYVR